jgi:lipopolysaccharide transport system ATP-binding protein
MYMRLAFAVAAHLDTEILLVDEVLAVGDAAFRKKCLGKMDTVARQGRTVLFVSHNLQAVRNLCTTALLLENGRLRGKGTVAEIIGTYESSLTDAIGSTWVNPLQPAPGAPAHITQIDLLDADNRPCSSFKSSEDIRVRFTLQVFKANDRLKVGFDLVRNGEVAFRSQQVDCRQKPSLRPDGIRYLICRIPADLLKFGQYHLTPLMSIHMVRDLIPDPLPAVKFDVLTDTGGNEFHLLLNERNQPGPVFPLLDWEAL